MRKVVTLNKLVQIRKLLQRQGKKFVFTNGTFDILHRGHVEYLTKARTFGDVLAIGLNSDASIRRIKGKGRPINREADRAAVLAALAAVDYICFFSDDTPQKIIARLQPDVLVKGADWKLGKIVGREVVRNRGGSVRRVSLTEGRSTTRLIEQIVKLYGVRRRRQTNHGRQS
jgi:D-beta-D-heptose 7-phosphate kinase/D-beta-D-heptose 1-phosphate adenosyltransferase